MLVFLFERCDQTVLNNTCKSDAEFYAYAKKSHFLFVYNKENFISDEFGLKKFQKYPVIDWITIDIGTPKINPYSI